jgi:hypothetical protein
MKVIRPTSQISLTPSDMDFIVETLGRQPEDAPFLRQLMSDPDALPGILDHPLLHQTLLEQSGCLRVSLPLYFYVLSRNALRREGVDDRMMADYIASMLSEFACTKNIGARVPGCAAPLDYFFDMLAKLPELDPHASFALRTHMGNQALFCTGLFADRIRHRSETRGFPDVSYYESLGSNSYRTASHHPLAERLGLEALLSALAECFHHARRALNDLADRIFSLGDPPIDLERLIIRPA